MQASASGGGFSGCARSGVGAENILPVPVRRDPGGAHQFDLRAVRALRCNVERRRLANGRPLHAAVARVTGSRRGHRWVRRRRDRSRPELRVGRLSGRGSAEARRAALRWRATESEDHPVHVAPADLRCGHQRGCGTGCGIQPLPGGIGARSGAETAKRPEVSASNRQDAHHRRRMECREHTTRESRADPGRQVQDIQRHCGKPAMELSGQGGTFGEGYETEGGKQPIAPGCGPGFHVEGHGVRLG